MAGWASVYGQKLELDNFTRLLFYYLFMYGVGLRVGPSFVNSLSGDGLKFTLLAIVSCVFCLGIAVLGAKLLALPPGAAGGILAGSQSMSAAIGSAEQAVLSCVLTLPPGTTPNDVSAMIALSHGITYIWGTVGIILITKYLPRWWGIDASAAARDYEKANGVASGEGPAITGWRASGAAPTGSRMRRGTGAPSASCLANIQNTASATCCAPASRSVSAPMSSSRPATSSRSAA